GQDDQRQARVHGEHERGDEHQVEQFQNQVDDAVGQDVGHRVDVVDDADQDFALGPVVIIFERQLLQMPEQVVADVENDVLPDPRHDPAADGGQLDADDDGRQRDGGPEDEPGDV